MISSQQEQQFYQDLINQDKSIGQRYQAIFQLKNINTENSIRLLMNAYSFVTSSVLLAHQLLYCLGQVNEEHFHLIKDFLFAKVQDQTENGISRHQAAEALANYFHLIQDLDKFFQKYVNSQTKQLADTCKISLEKAKHKQLADHYAHKFSATKQPAAPFTNEEFKQYLNQKNLQEFFSKQNFMGLLQKPQTQITLFQKYRIMYYMRDLGTKNQIQTLCALLSKEHFRTQSPLLKHQVCFILGQIGCEQYQHLIRQCMQNDEQADIVRHEALAAVASQSKDVEYLKKFTEHENTLIRESAQVAEFTIKYWNE